MGAERPTVEPGGATELSISGMTCDGCAKTVARVLSRVPGVTGADVEFASGHAVVTGQAQADDLIAAVTAAGYGVQRRGPGDDADPAAGAGHARRGCG